MSDINKTIAELEELLTRTEPKPLTLHLKSYVTMHNALPELLRYAKIGSEPCPDCEDVVPRMEEAEDYANELTKVLLEHFPEAEGDSDYSGEDFYSANEFDRVISIALLELRERAEKAEKANRQCVDTAEHMRTLAAEEQQRRRRVEAERLYLAQKLATPTVAIQASTDEVWEKVENYFEKDVQEILKEAQEAITKFKEK